MKHSKPISLRPLTFEEVVTDILKIKPELKSAKKMTPSAHTKAKAKRKAAKAKN